MMAAVPQQSGEATLLRAWADRMEVEQFLFREAELADAHQYTDWQALWAKDLVYWVPANADDVDPARQISFIYDNRARLEDRIFRLNTPFAHSQRPRPRLVRTVANIQLVDYDSSRGGTVTSRVCIGETRRDENNIWMARVKHVLVREGGKLLMKEKHVFLAKNRASIGNLTFLL